MAKHGSAIFVLLAAMMLQGCSTLGTRMADSATVAARSPWTWGPLAGAAVIAATGSDRRISDWAKDHTPIYGSPEAALDASDRFRNYEMVAAWMVFAVAPPRGDGSWAAEKGIDAAGNVVAFSLAHNTTGVLKEATQRERPHGGPVHDSLPSAHATDAFANASMARFYTSDLPTDTTFRNGINALTGLFATATAWGRVEGGVHYPTDVLVGAAIGNFMTQFVLELNAPNENSGWRVRPVVTPAREVVIAVEHRF